MTPSFAKLVLRNLLFHWRGNVAVLLGVAVGSAVLTGALLVGDSLRGSLRARAERQLAGVEQAAIFPTPVRAAVTDGMPGDTAPLLIVPGTVAGGSPERSVGHVTLIGVDERSAKRFGLPPGAWNGERPVIALSNRVETRLGITAGSVKITAEKSSDLPRASTLARRSAEDVTTTRTLTVPGPLPADTPGNDFQLAPNPAAPLNVFVPLAVLSNLVQNDPAVKANAILSSGVGGAELNAALQSRLEPEDYGIRLREMSRRKYLSVESERMIVPPVQVMAIQRAAADLQLRAEPTVVYVVDTIAAGGRELPYAVVAGLVPAAEPPLGPFLPKGVPTLADDEIVLLDWINSPVNGLPAGTKLTVTYFNPEVEGEGKVETAELTLRGYVPLAGAANDRDLTPPVRGLTDERSDMRSWDRPPMLPRERVQARVPDNHPRAKFWTSNKATPMAYVNLATAERLFGSRYGSVTSVRIAPAAGEDPEQTAARLRPVLLKHLDPEAAGLTFSPVRDRLLSASRGGNDFGMLFLSFSCFLIAAALMLVGLLFRLSVDRRAKEIGLLLAAGYRRRTVLGLVLAEGLVLTLVGGALGLAAAVEYNHLLLRVLLSLWPDPEVASFLRPHAAPESFVLGFGLTVVMTVATLWLGVRGLTKVPPPALLRGETAAAPTRSAGRADVWWIWALAAGAVGAVAIVVGVRQSNPDFRAMSFFGGGALFLAGGLVAFGGWMRRARHAVVNDRGPVALARLGGRNAARNPGRSLLTAALLSSAAFLLVAVESFRRRPDADFLSEKGGSGGFNLIAEADVPLFEPLEKRYPLPNTDAFALRLRDGDDASCMNLYRATRPRVLGVPDGLIDRGGFKFYATEAGTPEERANPWLLLRRDLPDGVVPVFVENNTAVWMLKTGVGGEVTVPDDAGGTVRCRIVGTLVDSPFQSELIASESLFKRTFTADTGYRVFLVHTPPDQEEAVTHRLQTTYRANGLVVERTRDRVAAYQAVVGAYLSTFQLLGGFGLLLGVLGLAVVVLRGVWERLGELALLRAVGYRTRALQFLVLAEHALLLVVGLGSGILAALASVAPHVLDGASVPWGELLGLLGLVFVVGLGVASAATAGILRVPVIPALRRE